MKIRLLKLYLALTVLLVNSFFANILEKWFVLSVSISNVSSVGKLVVSMRVQGDDDWKEEEIDATYAVDIGDQEDKFIEIGESFNGIINSIEFITGHIVPPTQDELNRIKIFITKKFIECHPSCAEDSLCIGIDATLYSCLECDYSVAIEETEDEKKLGTCINFKLHFSKLN